MKAVLARDALDGERPAMKKFEIDLYRRERIDVLFVHAAPLGLERLERRGL